MDMVINANPFFEWITDGTRPTDLTQEKSPGYRQPTCHSTTGSHIPGLDYIALFGTIKSVLSNDYSDAMTGWRRIVRSLPGSVLRKSLK